MTGRRARSRAELAGQLGLEFFQFDRARACGDIPPEDRARGWSADLADSLLPRAAAIRAAAGSIPDVGAVRAAQVLTERLGITVTGDGVRELGRRGLLPVAGEWKGFPVYCGRALEAFADEAAAADACHAGRLQTAQEAAVYLLVRRTDLDHLVRAGLLAPADWGRGPYDRRGVFSVPLYRTGDLDDLARRPGIDWDAVRSARRRQRSPLAALSSREPERTTT